MINLMIMLKKSSSRSSVCSTSCLLQRPSPGLLWHQRQEKWLSRQLFDLHFCDFSVWCTRCSRRKKMYNLCLQMYQISIIFHYQKIEIYVYSWSKNTAVSLNEDFCTQNGQCSTDTFNKSKSRPTLDWWTVQNSHLCSDLCCQYDRVKLFCP